MTDTACPAALPGFADHLADVAGGILREQAGLPPQVEIKPDGTPVTQVDRMVEQAVRAEIMRAYPGHGILGEEFPAHQPEAEHLWIIDPLDGTKEFVQGLPLFGFLLALAWRGEIVLGLAEQPLLRHRWLGANGHGTVFNGRKVAVRPCKALADAVVSTQGYDTFCPAHHDRLLALRQAGRSTVAADSFYVFGLVANGRVDLVASDGFALHDYAALDAVVRNAGGVVTDWQGRRLTLESDRSIVAAGDAALLPAVLPLLDRGPRKSA
ncbi:MAG TPA: inositol monophosphatase family protein [Acetobacteraceae bacterium]|nr:inositol monophosphatase family protein [Acetobacteraceae bacterium]